eukprot:jgi/Astpho2/1085/e_gw1.00019.20.1_t
MRTSHSRWSWRSVSSQQARSLFRSQSLLLPPATGVRASASVC